MQPVKRSTLVRGAGGAAATAALVRLAPAYAFADAINGSAKPGADGAIDLRIAATPLRVGTRSGVATTINGTVPGPLIRLREGNEAVLRVRNDLDESTSIHWHGFLIPNDMDGVPGVAFPGIPAHSTFTYRFPVRQAGTYWCHSHSGDQEQRGLYAPIIIDPRGPDRITYDRDYVVMLSDWTPQSEATILGNLKRVPGYYNWQQPTFADLQRESKTMGWRGAIAKRLAWNGMRMDPTDFADVSGSTYDYLLNGLPPQANWYALHRPGERVRLRFIGAGAMPIFDVRIPGLPMTIVQADGIDVAPVRVDQFRIGPGETYDAIVEPGDAAYTIFAESMDRSGFARGTLAPRRGMTAPVPARGPRPMLTMGDMGMPMGGGAMAGMNMSSTAAPTGGMAGMAMGHGDAKPMAMTRPQTRGDMVAGPSLPGSEPVPERGIATGAEESAVPMTVRNRLDDPGPGLEGVPGKVLVYADLRALAPSADRREPTRSLEIHLSGNMDKYVWGFDGKKSSESPTIPLHYGERLRIFLVNDTMMEHPIHLHGMYMELENGAGELRPLKHTVRVLPAERLSVLLSANAPGRWAMHCHLLYHMDMGMFRVVEVA